MFTGIIEAIGRVRSIEKMATSATITIELNLPLKALKVGDSVAINGVCLTTTWWSKGVFKADIGKETLKVTTLGQLVSGDSVNIELPLKLGDRLGGHMVQGHIDGIGKILEINKIEGGFEVMLETPASLNSYIVKRGSVAIDGVSLTVTDCGDSYFKVFLIPHTIDATIFKYKRAGDCVNLEVDILGKYVEKQLTVKVQKPSITEEFLKEHGF